MEYQNICMGCMGDRGEAGICPHCGYMDGTPPPNAQYLLPRTMLEGKYLIGRGLGHGGFGITYIAYDTVLKRKLAIKEYLPQDCATRASGQRNVTPFSAEEKRQQFLYGVDKFLEEARTLAQFDGHPNIVGVRDFFKENNTAYLVMNYLSGETLKEYLRRHERALNFQQALKIMLPVIDALRTVHASGVLHRDVSPDNIFLTNNGEVKLIDFGAARQSLGNQRSISVILKPGYAPEEQYRSRGKQGPWTDVYATGATFYRAITGKVPPESLDRMEQDTLIPPSRLGVQIPMVAESALLRAMAVRAQDRFQSMQEFKDVLLASDRATQTLKNPSSASQNAQAAMPRRQPEQPQMRREITPPVPERQPLRQEMNGRVPSHPDNRAQQMERQRKYAESNTYPLKSRGRSNMRVGILIAAIIVLVVVGGVLLGLYALGDMIDRNRATQTGQLLGYTPTPSTTGQFATSEPPATTVPADQVSPTIDATATPSPTPVPENMIPGAMSSMQIAAYTPEKDRILAVQEGGQSYRLLTGELLYGLVGVVKIDDQNKPVGETYHYYTDSADGITYGPYDMTDASREKDVKFLPDKLEVGVKWNGEGAEYEIIAVDYTAELSGKSVENCLVIRAGTMYHFYVPGYGRHTTRTSLEEDVGVSYRVIDLRTTQLSLLEIIAQDE